MSLGLLVRIFRLWILQLSFSFVLFSTARFQLAMVMLLPRPLLCVFLDCLVLRCCPLSPARFLPWPSSFIFFSCPSYLRLLTRIPSPSFICLHLPCSFSVIVSIFSVFSVCTSMLFPSFFVKRYWPSLLFLLNLCTAK